MGRLSPEMAQKLSSLQEGYLALHFKGTISIFIKWQTTLASRGRPGFKLYFAKWISSR